jgi:hypothetical protein
MWIQVGVICVAGLAVTAVTLFRTRMFQKDHLMNMGSMLHRRLYWVFCGVALFTGRLPA